MRVLLDECLPKKLKRELPGYTVITVPEQGWAGQKNGALLQLAQEEFDVFVTIDQNLTSQQNLSQIDLAIVVLTAQDNQLETLQPLMPKVLEALETIQIGQTVQIS
jgi:predicted nuclease of predicted toxin-antitoxin system